MCCLRCDKPGASVPFAIRPSQVRNLASLAARASSLDQGLQSKRQCETCECGGKVEEWQDLHLSYDQYQAQSEHWPNLPIENPHGCDDISGVGRS